MIINKHINLSIQQEKVLIYRFIRKKCLMSVHKLIFSNIMMIFKISHKFNNLKIDFYDIFNEGLIGFLNAILYYNPEKNYKLVNFAFLWVHYVILNYVKKRFIFIKNKVFNENVSVKNSNKISSYFIIKEIEHNSFFLKYDNYQKTYKVKSALHSLLPLLQAIVYSSYIFSRSFSTNELSFFFNISPDTVRQLKKNILSILYILSI